MSANLIVTARAPRGIRRDGGTDTSDFVRAWWCGVRGFQPSAAMSGGYLAGYAAGVVWRDFHGRERRPHETHAADALRLYQEIVGSVAEPTSDS